MKPPHARFLVQDEARVREIVASMRRVAVLGIKTEAETGQPAYDVARYLATHGVEIVPVPVYFPDVTEILGRPVYRKVADVPGEIDVVDVFRRPRDLPPHLDDLLAKRPRVVWLQSGIWHAEFAEALARAEIEVVQNRCLMVDLMRL
ncbi:MAG: CoA-binding protein [Myxococcales bacterium]|nr:CoA-binding protein [Myxococcales bacterium]MBL8718536.1 CoA-binding protein [Myxococcales bacterium]